MKNKTYTIKQTSERLGMPVAEVRYLLRRGLVPHVRRSYSGYRTLEDWQVDWVNTLVWLRHCGFTLMELKRYTRLCREGGDAILAERKAMIETHKQQLWQDLAELRERIDFLERKQEYTEQILTKKTLPPHEWI